jgi:putative membrane protein
MRLRRPWVLFGTVLPALATAHTSTIAAPIRWTWSAGITAPLLATLVLYLIGWRRLRRRSSLPLRNTQAAVFLLGWLVLTLALVSPLHALGERSFAAHMFEHELLMLVAAPLLVLGRPLGTLLWAWPAPLRRFFGGLSRGGVGGVWRALADPIVSTLLQAAVLWLWHAPALFDLALRNEGWHALQHLAFIVSALFFWTSMLDGTRLRQRPLVAVGGLFATSVVSGALGALMAFAHSPWYARYAELGLAPLGLTPTEDQQLAGLLMWVPGGVVHAAAALWILARLVRDRGAGADHAQA